MENERSIYVLLEQTLTVLYVQFLKETFLAIPIDRNETRNKGQKHRCVLRSEITLW